MYFFLIIFFYLFFYQVIRGNPFTPVCPSHLLIIRLQQILRNHLVFDGCVYQKCATKLRLVFIFIDLR